MKTSTKIVIGATLVAGSAAIIAANRFVRSLNLGNILVEQAFGVAKKQEEKRPKLGTVVKVAAAGTIAALGVGAVLSRRAAKNRPATADFTDRLLEHSGEAVPNGKVFEAAQMN